MVWCERHHLILYLVGPQVRFSVECVLPRSSSQLPMPQPFDLLRRSWLPARVPFNALESSSSRLLGCREARALHDSALARLLFQFFGGRGSDVTDESLLLVVAPDEFISVSSHIQLY